MTKLKGLLLTEGMHGMISQVEGLAKALDLDFIHEKIEINNFWKLFPPKVTPVQDFVFKNKIDSQFDVVISCGRKSVIPSIYLKKKFKNKIINIHIQEPKVFLDNFDFVVAPEHDGLKGNNVLTSKGAVHYLTNDELDQNENYLKSRINSQKKIVTLILGGPTRYYDYNNQVIEGIFSKIEQNFIKNNYQVIIIPSMRTPQNIIEKAKNYFDKDQIIIPNVDKKAYLSSLKISDHIIVTCDSTSMISEAAITGKPIYVAQMPAIKNNQRFKSFFNLFESLNIIKELNNSIENWTYTKLNETNKIANQIKEKIKQHDFS
ncbi:mitochondrial fission ELM1 family protein [Candidatus Pelagibacter sp. Uisw_127]|jgi:mitochondrial fission protein ELM1|uniref:mitochondrial fission ELM1 family protein n=1 Tax=Candidatus Pelagibacter sp. Uisw_127 TaxID=3230988 RepID=UPI0039ED9449